MTPQHFNEIFFTILMSTKSDKGTICKHLGISRVALNRYLRDGLHGRMKFLILDRLEVYLFSNLGGSKNAVSKQA